LPATAISDCSYLGTLGLKFIDKLFSLLLKP
jgi:hypothetical protein